MEQKPHLFPDSVRANVKYSNPGATDEEMVAACEAVGINEAIAKLSRCYDDQVQDGNW